MASPVDAARTPTNISTAINPVVLNQPGSIAAGDFLLLFSRVPGSSDSFASTGSWSEAGWTAVLNDSSDATDDLTSIFWKKATGTEGATLSIPTAFSGTIKAAAIMYRITGAEDPTVTLFDRSTTAVGTTTANTANPASVSVTGGPKDVLYLALMGLDGETSIPTAAPTNYVNLQTANSGTGGAVATNCIIATASRAITASSSDDPGVFTHPAANAGWTAITLVIPPPAAAGAHGSSLQTLRQRRASRFLTSR